MSSIAPPPIKPQPILAVWTLGAREVRRFFRQRNRVIGAIGQPILFWALFGVGLDGSFRTGGDTAGGQSFGEYFIPGVMMMIILFTAIFTTISIIEDRKEGFLQAVLVAPVPRWAMVLGKVLGGAFIAMFQGIVFLALALLYSDHIQYAGIPGLLLLMFLSATALTSLGVLLAWRMDSTQGFHAIMSVLLMPMWLLSGAFFPLPAANETILHTAMRYGMLANPVTYCVAGVRRMMYTSEVTQNLDAPSVAVCWIVAILFALLTFSAACQRAKVR